MTDPSSKPSPGTSTRCSTAVPTDPDAAVTAMIAEAQRRADEFAAAHAGKVAELDGPGLVAAMRDLEALQELLGRAGSYAMLNFSGDTADPPRGALLQKVQEGGTRIETTLLFFELEWAALDDERADELLAADGLDFARHHLRTARRYRPHLLSEPEEKVLAEKSLTGSTAWSRLFEEQASAIAVDLDEGAEPVSLDAALSRLFARRPRGPPRRRRARHRRARARPAHARVRAQHAARRQDGRRPAAQLPALARQPQPLQRGVRRVGRGADLRGPVALRGDAPLVPPEGPPARDRPAGRLRPDGRDHGRRTSASSGRRRATSCSTPTARSRTSWARWRGGSSTSPGSTPRCGRTSAAARSAPTRSRPRTRTCSSTTRTSAATCSRSRTSSATACTPRSAPARACSTWPRR